ncbi:MAG: response regulator, partial [Candidatus Marinimicrobia bacterium]|nr:response regulator [Candidatus Neomarinimicrobiota bacterium]
VSIKDTGYGIAKKDFNKIFDIYYTTKPEGLGTGLGLVIVKDIIEKQHKGKVLVESEVSKGTTFTIQLPIEKKAKRKILVVDDEAFMRELFTGYFEEKGLDAFEAQNGEEALQYYEKIQPDIILADIQMPFMDGFELAERVRVKNSAQKIIFMTGYYFEHDIQSKLKKSDIKYFTKPADFDVVWEMISKELKSETP